MKPVRLPAAATLALPRWGLVVLCMLYILPGILRRDPWKTDDAAGFGIMWTMAHGSLADWLSPNIAGLSMPNEAPLAFWVGALLIKLLGWLLTDAVAARISVLVFFAIGVSSVWRTAYVLGRRSEAQPLKLAFGGQPAAMDYGRTLADGAVLIYVACLGLLLRSHETATPALHVSLVAAAFYAAACVFDKANRRAAAGLGVALGLLVLARGWTVPLALLITLMILAAVRYRDVTLHLVRTTLPIGVLIPLAWLLAHRALMPDGVEVTEVWLNTNLHMLSWPRLATLGFLAKTLLWYTWPAWPIAAWAAWAWRSQATLHVMLTVSGVAALLLLNLFTASPKDHELLSLLPPLAILATFGLPTLKRGAINAIDWFSVMTLTAIASFIWLGWIAKQTGWPEKLAKNAFKVAPGFQPEFNFIALMVAMGATAGWVMLLRWRLGRQPSVLWRAVVLSTGGLVLCWVLLMTLWLPWLNYAQSYASVAEEMKTHLPETYRCVDTLGVGPAQRASFGYLGGVNFSRSGQAPCELLLVQDDGLRHRGASLKKIEGNLTLLWQGRRPSDRHEFFRLYKRNSP
jgi:4-amino-4-deoxy-L-arabinose transferase-like glycosyltransferase